MSHMHSLEHLGVELFAMTAQGSERSLARPLNTSLKEFSYDYIHHVEQGVLRQRRPGGAPDLALPGRLPGRHRHPHLPGAGGPGQVPGGHRGHPRGQPPALGLRHNLHPPLRAHLHQGGDGRAHLHHGAKGLRRGKGHGRARVLSRAALRSRPKRKRWRWWAPARPGFPAPTFWPEEATR